MVFTLAVTIISSNNDNGSLIKFKVEYETLKSRFGEDNGARQVFIRGPKGEIVPLIGKFAVNVSSVTFNADDSN